MTDEQHLCTLATHVNIAMSRDVEVMVKANSGFSAEGRVVRKEIDDDLDRAYRGAKPDQKGSLSNIVFVVQDADGNGWPFQLQNVAEFRRVQR